MLFTPWLRSLKSRSTRSTHRRKGSSTPINVVEALEDRTLLSVITIDPGDYTGSYRVEGAPSPTFVRGVTSYDLAAGDYLLQPTGTAASRISFNVGTDGSVTSNSAAAAAGVDGSQTPDGIRETLRFNTTMIVIDTGLYTGSHGLAGVSGFVTGPQTLALIPGVSGYHVILQHGGGNFLIDVDDFGNVQSQVAATATGVDDSQTPDGIRETLRFNTKTVTIDPGVLTANYGMSFIGSEGTGIQTHELVPGVDNYYVKIRQPGTNFEFFGNFHFDVDANGNVTPRDPNFATGTGSTLAINTRTVKIDPGDYAGAPGIQTYQVPVGQNYVLWLHHGGPLFTFDIDANGNIISANTDAATAAANTLTFKTTTITIDPGDYAGSYAVQGIGSLNLRSGGQRSDVVLLGIGGYVVSLQHGGGIFRFNVDANGNAVSQNAAAAIGNGSTLRFQTTTLNIDPGSYVGLYRLPFITNNVTGQQSISMVPGVSSYNLSAGGSNPRFTINAAGEPNPGSLSLTIGGETFTFLLTAVTNVTPGITSVAAVNAAENQTSVIDVQSSDPDGETEGGGGLTYNLTGGADQALFTIDTNSGVLTFNASPDFETPGDVGGNNVYDVQVTVTDAAGLAGVQDIAVTVTNVNEAPALGLITEKSVDEASLLSLTATATDPDVGETLTFSLDSPPSGATIDAATGVFTWTPPDGPASTNVTVRVTDSGGAFDTKSFLVTVNNVAPTAVTDSYNAAVFTLLVADNAVLNNNGVLANDTDPAGAFDPLEVASANGSALNGVQGTLGDGSVTFTTGQGATVTMNDDGTFTYDATSSGTLLSLAESVTMNDTFAYTIDDGDGGTATETVTVTVTGGSKNSVHVIDCFCADGSKALVVRGSSVDDKIDVKPGLLADTFKIKIKTAAGGGAIGSVVNDTDGSIGANGSFHMGTFKFDTTAAGISKVIVYGLDGNDSIKVHSTVGVMGWLFGGNGDDKLRGGKGDDLLVGGPGNDRMDGKAGQDILIGGDGADKMKGKQGEDLLIGGWTSFDNNLAALTGIMDEWRSANSFVDRVANISNGGGSGSRANSSFFFDNSTVVVSDGYVDELDGGDGADWFIASVADGDKVKGFENGADIFGLETDWFDLDD